jgi:hypothetical protein
MNPRQRFVLLVGILLIGLGALYPPWNLVDQYIGYSGMEVERFAGYSFFFSPPTPGPPMNHTPVATVSRIDTRRLTVEWAAVVIVVIGLLLLLRSQPIPRRAPEPEKSPPAVAVPTETQKTPSSDDHTPASASLNPPNKPAKPPTETRRILEFLTNADCQEFKAATAAILQGLKMKSQDKERAYCWITEHRGHFGGLLFLDHQPRDRYEAAILACMKRQMPEVEKQFRSITWAVEKVTSIKHRVAAHWAIAALLDRRGDLDALAQEPVEAGLTSHMMTDHDPLLFLLDRVNPQLPPWLPRDWGPNGRPLSPVEMVEWFDELLKRDYGPSSGWPPKDDVETRRQEIVKCLYVMYNDLVSGILPKPSFIRDEDYLQPARE